MDSADFCELTIENFLSIRHFQAKITPIVVLYGDNGSGKSIVAKLLYAMQQCFSIGLPSSIYSHKTPYARYLGEYVTDSLVRLGRSYNSNMKESLEQESLYKAFIKHAGERKGLPISRYLQDTFFDILCDSIKQHFSIIPQCFGYQEWKSLIGNDENQQRCVFSSINSKFQGKVVIESTEDGTLIKPELKLYDSQRICLSLLSDHDLKQTNEEKVPTELLSEFWNDPIFATKSILLSIQQSDNNTFEKFEISLPIELYESVILSCFRDSELEWVEYMTNDNQFTRQNQGIAGIMTPIIAPMNSPISPILRFEELRKNIEKHKENRDLEKSIKFRLLGEFVVRILDVLAVQLPFNFFPNSKESLFFPPGKMQIMLDFNRILREFLRHGGSGLYESAPEIRDFLLFILRSTDRVDLKRIGRETKIGELLEKLREIQGSVYLNRADEGKLTFYNERTKKESSVYDVPSSVLNLMPFDLLLRGIGLNPRSVSIIFEELENHLHPSNIEKLCNLVAELCLMSRKDEEKNKNLKTDTNMIITTHSFHVLFFLLFAVGSRIHPKKVKDYYTAVRLDLSENQEYTVSKVIDMDGEAYLIDPYIDEDISINRGMQKWIRRWKEPIKGESERDK